MHLLVLIQVFFLFLNWYLLIFNLVCLGPEDVTPCSTEQKPKWKSEGDLEMGQAPWLQRHPGEVPQHTAMPQLRLSDAWEGAWPGAAQGVFKHQR